MFINRPHFFFCFQNPFVPVNKNVIVDTDDLEVWWKLFEITDESFPSIVSIAPVVVNN